MNCKVALNVSDVHPNIVLRLPRHYLNLRRTRSCVKRGCGAKKSGQNYDAQLLAQLAPQRSFQFLTVPDFSSGKFPLQPVRIGPVPLADQDFLPMKDNPRRHHYGLCSAHRRISIVAASRPAAGHSGLLPSLDVYCGRQETKSLLAPETHSRKEKQMSGVYKITELVGTSPVSFAEAARAAVEEAAKTVRHMDWLEVARQSARIKDGNIEEFQVTVKIGFKIER